MCLLLPHGLHAKRYKETLPDRYLKAHIKTERLKKKPKNSHIIHEMTEQKLNRYLFVEYYLSIEPTDKFNLQGLNRHFSKALKQAKS